MNYFKITIRDTNSLREKIQNLEGKEKIFFEDLIKRYDDSFGSRYVNDDFDENALFIAGVEKCGITYCTCSYLGNGLYFDDTDNNHLYVNMQDISDCIIDDENEFKQCINTLNKINELCKNNNYDIILQE